MLMMIILWLRGGLNLTEAEFSGSHIASIDLNTLEILQVSNLEEREKLLSAIYHELHPPNSTTQRLDSLLGTVI